jgi:hypothetical protein
VMRDGEVIARRAGAAPADELRDWLDLAITMIKRGSVQNPTQEVSR